MVACQLLRHLRSCSSKSLIQQVQTILWVWQYADTSTRVMRDDVVATTCKDILRAHVCPTSLGALICSVLPCHQTSSRAILSTLAMLPSVEMLRKASQARRPTARPPFQRRCNVGGWVLHYSSRLSREYGAARPAWSRRTRAVLVHTPYTWPHMKYVYHMIYTGTWYYGGTGCCTQFTGSITHSQYNVHVYSSSTVVVMILMNSTATRMPPRPLVPSVSQSINHPPHPHAPWQPTSSSCLSLVSSWGAEWARQPGSRHLHELHLNSRPPFSKGCAVLKPLKLCPKKINKGGWGGSSHLTVYE